LDILILALFRASAYEDDEPVTVFAEVDAIAGTEVDSVFMNSSAYAFHAREISLLHARESDSYFGCC
jgi:hypothetical protein